VREQVLEVNFLLFLYIYFKDFAEIYFSLQSLQKYTSSGNNVLPPFRSAVMVIFIYCNFFTFSHTTSVVLVQIRATWVLEKNRRSNWRLKHPSGVTISPTPFETAVSCRRLGPGVLPPVKPAEGATAPGFGERRSLPPFEALKR
jgi:hypothetical protein